MSAKLACLSSQVVSVILVLFGIAYVSLGLKILPVSRDVLEDWESALYGAIMVGWGVTLFLVGPIAINAKQPELGRALLAGLGVWLAIEAAASVYFGVWFNVGVDLGVMALFAFPLIKSLRE
jgi:hypothetical protein